ncbi:hypothetical protein [Prevotella intermedia]|uniref:hypothetical protein n=1 Tax=Prevotella intermedia TaxID=28131 RepID=UPI003979FF07
MNNNWIECFNWIDHFTTVIQLMCAVNFGYIAISFPRKVFDIFFDRKRLLDKPYNKLIDTERFASDLESAKKIDSNSWLYSRIRNKIEDFKEEKNDAIDTREAGYRKIDNKIKKHKNVKGVKSFFFFISIYGVTEMILLALMSSVKEPSQYLFFLIFLVFLNIGVVVYSSYLVWSVWNHKMNKKDDGACYVGTVSVYAILLIIALVLTFLHMSFFEHTDFRALPLVMSTNIFLSGGIVLLFVPLFFSNFYLWFFTQKIKRETKEFLMEVNKKQKELQKLSDEISKKISDSELISIK